MSLMQCLPGCVCINSSGYYGSTGGAVLGPYLEVQVEPSTASVSGVKGSGAGALGSGATWHADNAVPCSRSSSDGTASGISL